jgi:hypothetical protein
MTSELLGQRSCQSLSISSLNLHVAAAAAPCRSCPTFPVLRLLFAVHVFFVL